MGELASPIRAYPPPGGLTLYVETSPDRGVHILCVDILAKASRMIVVNLITITIRIPDAIIAG